MLLLGELEDGFVEQGDSKRPMISGSERGTDVIGENLPSLAYRSAINLLSDVGADGVVLP